MMSISRETLEWLVPLLETGWVTLTVLVAILGAVAGVMGLAFWWYNGTLKGLKEAEDLYERQSIQLRTEELRNQNLELQAELVEAQQTLFKMKERLAARAITDEQFDIMVEKLRPFAGQEYEISSYPDRGDSSSLAGRIRQVLSQAGWISIDVRSVPIPGTEGVLISVNPHADDKVQRAATILTDTLVAVGIDAIRTQPMEPPNRLSLTVGTKPGVIQ